LFHGTQNIILLGKTKCQTEMITVSPCS